MVLTKVRKVKQLSLAVGACKRVLFVLPVSVLLSEAV